MCGIFALLCPNDTLSYDVVNDYFMKGKKRGPEFSILKKIKKENYTLYIGFHRLAINGLDEISNQPIVENNKHLICNGEIYNYKTLYEKQNIIPKTNSDCEVIMSLYERNGSQCVSMLDGVFSFVLYDQTTNQVMIARDPYGVRPLYECYYEDGIIGFSSDLECLTFNTIHHIQAYQPGSYTIFQNTSTQYNWNMVHREKYFFNISYLPLITFHNTIEYYMYTFVSLLKNAVYKRVQNCERNIACLLSGGLDSSIISSLVRKMYFEKTGYILETYSIGLSGAEDFKYANQVASHINSTHHEIIMTHDEMIESIPHVIKDIESYDTTTVRASVGNWNIGKYISQHSDSKVIFNGDGSDELAGGYLYFNACPNDEMFDEETRRLLKDIHRFDVLRSDKSISSHGLEPRTPFLDKELTRFYLSIPIEYRNHNQEQNCEKYFIRKSIEIYEPNLLPHDILWRQKEAFSDGISNIEKSWYEIIQEHDHIKNVENTTTTHWEYNSPVTKEQKYYRTIFDSYFPKQCETLIPYFWMPRFIEQAHDASARTLKLYTRTENKITNGMENDR